MRNATWIVLAITLGLMTACGGGGGGGGPAPSTLPQTGSVSVDLITGAVTIVTGPPALTVTGTSTYDDPADELRIDLTVLNSAYARLLFNLKMLVTNLNEGAYAGDGTFGGDPFAYYGPEALAPAASAMRSITLTGIQGGVNPITFDMEWLNHRMVFHNAGWDDHAASDLSGTGMGTEFSTESTGFGGADADSHWSRGVISPDGRFLYLGNHNQPCITQVDTTTLLAVNTVDLTGADDIQTDYTGSIGHVRDVKLTRDGQTIYCVYTEGDHTAAWGGSGISKRPSGVDLTVESVFLVRMDRATLTETGRIPLVASSSASARGHSLAMNAAETLACVTISGEAQVWLLDLTTMTAIDVDAGTAGTQPYDVSAVGLAPQTCAMNAAGTTIHVAYRGTRNVGDGLGGAINLAVTTPNDGTLTVIDIATGGLTTLTPSVTIVGNRPGYLGWGPDGRLFYARKTSGAGNARVDAYNPGTMLWDEILVPTDRPYALAFLDGTECVISEAHTSFHVFDLATDTLVLNPADGTNTRPTAATDGFGHSIVISPF